MARFFTPQKYYFLGLALVGSTDKCFAPSVQGDKYCYLHQWRIRKGMSISAPCIKCGRGTERQSRLCTKCEEVIVMNKRDEARARKKQESNARVGI